jgi:uncharacterized membrane protein HdeD (DUF308 family)
MVARRLEDGVAAYDSSSHVRTTAAPSRWACALLGVVMVVAGILALSDIVFATIIGVRLTGLTAIAPMRSRSDARRSA